MYYQKKNTVDRLEAWQSVKKKTAMSSKCLLSRGDWSPRKTWRGVTCLSFVFFFCIKQKLQNGWQNVWQKGSAFVWSPDKLLQQSVLDRNATSLCRSTSRTSILDHDMPIYGLIHLRIRWAIWENWREFFQRCGHWNWTGSRSQSNADGCTAGNTKLS